MNWYEDPVYIKMCEKAEEIQKLKTFFEKSDFVIAKSMGFPYFQNIWLPSQSQLQVMSGFSPTSTEAITKAIYTFRISSYGCLFAFVATMEQLWLAYLMQKKYGKIWQKEEWVNED